MTEDRDGFYIGTDQPHTDEHGYPLSPRGFLMLPSDLPKKGFTYFIQHETGGPIKIGVSLDPEDRCRSLNINTHAPGYSILALLPGGKRTEREMHVRFRHLRVHGEWFLPESDLVDFIAGCRAAEQPLGAV